LDFEPRTRWSYSNTGYILLGRIVEKVSGRPFGEFLTERILRPLGLDHTVYEPDASDPRLARGHSRFALGNPEAVTPEARGWVGAAGGIYSTPSDLAKWNLALIDGRVLKPASLALMTTPRQLDNGKWTDYGCGLSVRIQGGRQVLSHNGAVSGFNAWNAVIPSTRSCVIMMCNLDGGLGTLPGQVFALLQKEPSNVPAVRAAPATNVVRELFLQLQAGRVNRNRLGAEFDHFLTPEKVAAASQRLKPFGRPRAVELLGVSERGGMEVTTARLRFRSGSLRSLMYRQPDGTIEQFFVLPD
ncbi:MAG TPA: serine hydrolase domain-containing protein, partial [Methylomirabilota bacterium]|nr:serine hydrolase domain-containing protein [Methylomirabilota bacterium]